jgi:hypothetical protein
MLQLVRGSLLFVVLWNAILERGFHCHGSKVLRVLFGVLGVLGVGSSLVNNFARVEIF